MTHSVFSSNSYLPFVPYTSALRFLYINCGGREVTVNRTTYEEDIDPAGPSNFFRRCFWAFSSTGIFTGDNRDDDILILENTQLSTTGDALYTTARRSPSSLTYYAFCLKNATYRVNLHFVEIQFTDGQNYSSLGRRIFDIYIQVF